MNEESLFDAALGLQDTAERQAFLDEACGDDPFLRQRLGQLLAADEHARGILDRGQDAAATLGAYRTEALLGAGQVFAGHYWLREKIGEGGMGEVWVADQAAPVRRRVALKLMRPELGSARQVARFEAERQALALMDHPNIAKVFDAGVSGGRPFFVMDLIDGVPITRYCDEAGLSPGERLGLFVSVCRAVQHAHQKGVIHRDIKPSNILVATCDGKPVPKVIDFGLAKATGPRLFERNVSTEVGFVVGTVEYMSPEQADPNGLDVDTRSDVYSLGVLLYELLTGTVPFSREQLQTVPFAELLRILREVEPPSPSSRLAEAETRLAEAATLPGAAPPQPARTKKLTGRARGELDWIVMKCLEKDRERRYESASALGADVQRYLADEPVLARPPSAGYRLRKFLRRNRGPALCASLVVLALVGGIVGTTAGLVSAVRAQRAEAERAEGERRAKEMAERRLAQVERGIDVLGSIFEDLDPKAEEKEGRPLRAILGDRLDRAVAEVESGGLGDPLVVARLQDRLGWTCLGLGRSARAEALFARASATREAVLGPDDPLTLHSRHNLAAAYRDGGKRAEAVRLFEQVRDDQVRVLGADHLATLTTLDGLGAAYARAGMPAKAIAVMEPLRDVRVKQHGAEDDRTVNTQNNLAMAYLAAGRTGEAINLCKRVLEVRRRKHRAEDFHTLIAVNNLAFAYKAGYRMREAIQLFEEARDAVVPKLGPDHELTLTLLTNLARTYLAFGRTSAATALAEQVRERRMMLFGPRHPATLTALDSLGLAYRDAGKPDKALPLFQQAAAGVEKLQFAHDLAGLIVSNLCDCHQRLKQHDQAEAWWRKWLAVVKEKEGVESPAYTEAILDLGPNLLEQKKFAEAEPVLREALALLRTHLPGTWRTSHTEYLLGAALLGQRRQAEAEPRLVQGYEGMKKHQGQTRRCPHSSPVGEPLAQAAGRLVELYDGWGKPDEAARWRKELESLEDPAKE